MLSIMGAKGDKNGFFGFFAHRGYLWCLCLDFLPRRPKKRPNPAIQTSNLQGFLVSVLLGFIAAALSSYVGQYLNLFQAGQMLEWASAILASCAAGFIYKALVK